MDLVGNSRWQRSLRVIRPLSLRRVADVMRRPGTIAQLHADARVYGRCPTCQEDFLLERALLFYADAPLPDAARTRLEARRADLQARAIALRGRLRRERLH
jgi:hypothetical protein